MPPAPLVIQALVALSGLAGLVYEIVWIRAVGLHLGTSTPAIALVTATFMAGLALGNAWLGRLADRAPRPLVLYARIELGIGLFGSSVSLLLLRAGSLLDAVSRAAEQLGAFALPARAFALVLLLLVPTTLMGGTVPVVSRALVRHGNAGAAVGGIYAWNTLGAVIGVLLPDFWLVPSFGFGAAVVLAASCNLIVASLAFWLARGEATSAPFFNRLETSVDAAPRPSPDAADDAARLPLALALTTISGFCGMALEVLFARTLSHWTSALVTSFAVLLAVYLIALALGAFAVRRAADRVAAPERVAAMLLALAGVAVVTELALAPEWRVVEQELWPRVLRRPSLLSEATEALLHAGYLEALPCLLMGAAFPFVAKTLVRVQSAGRSTGRLFTINTLAGTLGSLCAGFIGLAALGQQRSYLLAALLLVAPGAFVLVSSRRAGGVWLVCASSFAFVIGAWLLLPADHLLRAHFRGGGKIEAVSEGATTTAAVELRYVFGAPHHRVLLTPGVSMSDTSFGARRYMGMMAHAAMLAAKGPKRALLICYGVGNTARSLLSHPELQSLDIVDISPEVVSLGPRFSPPPQKSPLADPRSHVFIDDGRHHMIARGGLYDVITAEPPPPNHAGVVNLYSREFYRLASQHLSPGGVITQWLPVFQLSVDDMRTMIAAFEAELPHTALLYGFNQQWILIGSKSPLVIDPTRSVPQGVQADLLNAGITSLADIAGSVLQTDAELRRLVAHDVPLSDDQPAIQYPWSALDAYPSYVTMLGENEARAGFLLPPGASDEARASVVRSARATAAVLDVLDAGMVDEAADEIAFGNGVALALVQRPRDESLLALRGVESETARLAAAALSRPGAEALLRLSDAQAAGLHRARERAIVLGAAQIVARRAFYRGQYDRALVLLDAFNPPPTWLATRDLLAGTALRALGRGAEAQQRLQRAASESGDPEVKSALQRLAARATSPLDPQRGPFWAAH